MRDFTRGGAQDYCDYMNARLDLGDLADEMAEHNPDLGARLKELIEA